MTSAPIFYAIFHLPGPRWQQATDFRQQPGVMEHVGYFAKVFEAGNLLLGGPFLDNSGGLAVVQAASLKEAEKIASQDPGVMSGLLNYQVRPWMVPFIKHSA